MATKTAKKKTAKKAVAKKKASKNRRPTIRTMNELEDKVRKLKNALDSMSDPRVLMANQNAQIQDLYNQVGVVLRDSNYSPAIMVHTLEMLKQTILREQRARLGVDGDPGT